MNIIMITKVFAKSDMPFHHRPLSESDCSSLALAHKLREGWSHWIKPKNNNFNRLLFILNLTRDKLKITDYHSVLELLYMKVF